MLEIAVNAGGTSVVFKIGSAGATPSTVATNTTNIPIVAGREVGVVASITKSVGTTARYFDLDYLGARCVLTTAR
jgi:hypothetical protein